MKTLIVAACVAIVAFVSYFFWQEHRQSEARENATKRVECRNFLEAVGNGSAPVKDIEQTVKGCLFDGAISEADVDLARERIRARIPPGWR